MVADEPWLTYQEGPGGAKATGQTSFPHPYCITPKHLADEDGIYLDAERIKRAEGRGARCGICVKSRNGILSYDEHEKGLLVTIPGMTQRELNQRLQDGWDAVLPGLQAWLKGLVPVMEKDGFKGVALKAGN